MSTSDSQTCWLAIEIGGTKLQVAVGHDPAKDICGHHTQCRASDCVPTERTAARRQNNFGGRDRHDFEMAANLCAQVRNQPCNVPRAGSLSQTGGVTRNAFACSQANGSDDICAVGLTDDLVQQAGQFTDETGEIFCLFDRCRCRLGRDERQTGLGHDMIEPRFDITTPNTFQDSVNQK